MTPLYQDMVLAMPMFKEWLSSKPAQEIVGISYNSCRCPLASFLKEQCNIQHIQVRRDRIKFFDPVGDHWQWTKLPRWAQEFVDLVDYDDLNGPISAQVALRILCSIREF